MTSSNYPIVDAKPLGEARRTGLLGIRRPVRGAAEIPETAAHHVLVYRVGGELVLDSARLQRDDDDVVRATHVSVVDIRSGAPVVVELAIPSRDAAEFAVHVTFACTVTDPITIVRDGIHAATVLRSYLTRHSRLFQLGRGYSIDDVVDVRRDVDAQITAYSTLKPPVVTGLGVALVGVEVLTPAEVIALERARREQRKDHRLAREKRNQERALELDEEEGDHALRSMRDENFRERDVEATRYRYESEGREQEHRLQHAEADQRHRINIQRIDDAYERDKFVATAELMGTDPREALLLAYTTGAISSERFAEQMVLEEGRRLDREAAHEERERVHWREDREFDRDYRIRKLEARETRHAAERADRRERDGWERADRLQGLIWKREDEQRREAEGRQDRVRQLDLNLEVLREYAKRGHLDLVTVNLDRVINQLIPGADKELSVGSSDDALPEETPGLEVEAREEDGDSTRT